MSNNLHTQHLEKAIEMLEERSKLAERRLEFVYHLTAVKPFIAPIVTLKKWLERIDVELAKEAKNDRQ